MSGLKQGNLSLRGRCWVVMEYVSFSTVAMPCSSEG